MGFCIITGQLNKFSNDTKLMKIELLLDKTSEKYVLLGESIVVNEINVNEHWVTKKSNKIVRKVHV